VSNPIQEVLEAERDANEHIKAAQLAADAAIADARRQAKAIVARNELRTQRNVERCERNCRSQLDAEAEALRRIADGELTDYKALVDEQFDSIVEETFRQAWPGFTDSA